MRVANVENGCREVSTLGQRMLLAETITVHLGPIEVNSSALLAAAGTVTVGFLRAAVVIVRKWREGEQGIIDRLEKQRDKFDDKRDKIVSEMALQTVKQTESLIVIHKELDSLKESAAKVLKELEIE